MKLNYIKLNQFDLEMYMIKLKIEELINIYTIDLYNPKIDDGYQRKPIPPHFRNIGKYLQKENPILPSAILAAVDKEQLKEINASELQIEGEIRIVDGQHRIEGFKYLQKIDGERFSELRNFEFPVILMKIGEKQRIHEVNTFIDINSKGKKVSTDLAIRLRSKNFIEKPDLLKEEKQIIEAIATSSTLLLNKSIQSPQWLNSIKTSPNDINNIISINAFNTSLNPLIKQLIEKEKDKIKTKKDIDIHSNNIKDLLIECWNIISNKWSDCFTSTLNFNKQYNIQKGIGVQALHLILSECYEKNEGDIRKTIESFEHVIFSSGASSNDWLSGGVLSGYNSASGFKKIADYIKTGKLNIE